jgi:hypothetical protein
LTVNQLSVFLCSAKEVLYPVDAVNTDQLTDCPNTRQSSWEVNGCNVLLAENRLYFSPSDCHEYTISVVFIASEKLDCVL